MHPREIEETPLRRIPALPKLVAALLIIAGIAALPRRPHVSYVVPGIVLLVLWLISRMPLGFALKRLLLAEFFIVGMAILSLMVPGSAPLFLSAILKSNLCVLVMVMLVWTTSFHEILAALRQIRVPSIMLTTIALLCRYLPVLREESRRMQRALASRTFSRNKSLQWHGLSTLAGHLFIRSADRAERIYMAMRARGWK